MNAKLLVLTSLSLLVAEASGCAPSAVAGEARSLPQVQAIQYVFECAAPRALPSQRQVGEWAGQHNFAQVYETRQKLMAEVARACNKAGIERVNLVRQVPVGDADTVREVALTLPAGH